MGHLNWKINWNSDGRIFCSGKIFNSHALKISSLLPLGVRSAPLTMDSSRVSPLPLRLLFLPLLPTPLHLHACMSVYLLFKNKKPGNPPHPISLSHILNRQNRQRGREGVGWGVLQRVRWGGIPSLQEVCAVVIPVHDTRDWVKRRENQRGTACTFDVTHLAAFVYTA